MPRLKSLLSLPSDKALLQRLEATVKDLLLRETDADVLFALQTSIQDLDGTDTGKDIFFDFLSRTLKTQNFESFRMFWVFCTL